MTASLASLGSGSCVRGSGKAKWSDVLNQYQRRTDLIPNHSKLQAFRRKAAARTIDDLWDVIRDALPRCSPQDCANHLTAAGFEPD